MEKQITAAGENIRFRPMTLGDLPLMHRWVNMAHVREWWDPLPTLEAVAAKYTVQILGREPTRSFIIEADARPVGYIQTYRIADYPNYARHLGAEGGSVGVDLLIGDEEYVGHGAGSEILREFLESVVFADQSVTECSIGPEIANGRAIRAYEKAGFKYWKTVQIPSERAPEYLMRIRRQEFDTHGQVLGPHDDRPRWRS